MTVASTDDMRSSTLLRTFAATVVAFLGPVVLQPRVSRIGLDAIDYTAGSSPDSAVVVIIALSACLSCGLTGLVVGLLFNLGWRSALTAAVGAGVLTLVLGSVAANGRGVALNLPLQALWAALGGICLFSTAIFGAWLRRRLAGRSFRADLL